MKKIKLYIAASIDGYISGNDGDLDWLMKYPVNSETNYGYNSFFESIDTVVMGGRTYRDIHSMDYKWPYKGKITYVVTHNPMTAKEGVRFITENVIENISKLRDEKGKDLWLVGGSELISMLLDRDMIDEMIITTIPVILGSGIPLFQNNLKESTWNLVNSTQYDNGVVQMVYGK